MVRVGGMSYRIKIKNKIGRRISDMTLLNSGKPIEADSEYMVAGWASVNPDTEGPPVYDLVEKYISGKKVIPEINRNLVQVEI